jgi:hypothetical protein
MKTTMGSRSHTTPIKMTFGTVQFGGAGPWVRHPQVEKEQRRDGKALAIFVEVLFRGVA